MKRKIIYARMFMCRVKLKINGPGPPLGKHFLACNCDTKSVSLNVFENGRQIGGPRFS